MRLLPRTRVRARALVVLGTVVLVLGPGAAGASAAVSAAPVAPLGGPIRPFDLGTFGAETSVAVVVDGERRVDGQVASADGHQVMPVEWLGGQTRALAPQGRVVARNDRGEVAGNTTDAAGAPRAVLWHDRTETVIHPEARFSVAVDLNQRGELLVAYTDADGTQHGALWQDGHETEVFTRSEADAATLGTPRPVAVNDDGAVVVAVVDAGGDAVGGFVWHQGTTTDLGSLGGGGTAPVAINEQGQVAGTSRTADGRTHAFLGGTGGMVDLGTLGGAESRVTASPAALSDRGEVIGTSRTAAGDIHGFVWGAGGMVDLGTLGGTFSEPAAVNTYGQVAGQSTTATGERHPFVWTNGELLDLGTLGGPQGHALALNEIGDVVGASQAPDGTFHATLWTHHPPV
jgi:probable HAF family extracellular repeat protein